MKAFNKLWLVADKDIVLATATACWLYLQHIYYLGVIE